MLFFKKPRVCSAAFLQRQYLNFQIDWPVWVKQ
jgi:hypothetical protein